MARSSAALRRPPVPVPSASPAGDFAPQGAAPPGAAPYGAPLAAAQAAGSLVERERRRGRGAQSNASGRYEPLARVAFDDGWRMLEDLPPFATTVTEERARKIITRNESPDISFDRSINPYRGCEHGCVYCFARPTHAYLGLSPGLDFETRLFSKPDAAALLRAELAKPGYACKVIALGANTDAYQPIERRLRITRSVLEVLAEHRHPVLI